MQIYCIVSLKLYCYLLRIREYDPGNEGVYTVNNYYDISTFNYLVQTAQ